MKKSIILVLAAAVVIGGVVGLYQFNKKVPTLDNVTADFTLSADDLFAEFDDNENAATSKYQGKIIEVNGQVARTKIDTSNFNVILKAKGSMMGGINCSLRDQDTSPPSKGQTVTIKGECRGFLMDVVLNNCVIIE